MPYPNAQEVQKIKQDERRAVVKELKDLAAYMLKTHGKTPEIVYATQGLTATATYIEAKGKEKK